MRLLRRNLPEPRLASVVFWASDAEVAQIDIARGPCPRAEDHGDDSGESRQARSRIRVFFLPVRMTQ